MKLVHKLTSESNELLVAASIDVATGFTRTLTSWQQSELDTILAEAESVVDFDRVEFLLRLSGLGKSLRLELKKLGYKEPKGKQWTPELHSEFTDYTKGILEVYSKVYNQDPSIVNFEDYCQSILDTQKINGISFNEEKAKRMLKHAETKLSEIPFEASEKSYYKIIEESTRPEDLRYTDSGRISITAKDLERLGTESAFQILEARKYTKAKEFLNRWLSDSSRGTLTHDCKTLGAVTGRCSHQSPNLGQVPSTRTKLGKMCRTLFAPPEGYYQVGVDLAAIELRILGHYLHRYDGGKYLEAFNKGNIHKYNAELIGCSVDEAKSFVYAWLYGGGIDVLSDSASITKEEAKEMSCRFMQNTKGLKELKEAVSKAVKTRGYVKAIDGRKIPVDKEYKGLNRLLQSTAAVVAKQWMINCFDMLRGAGIDFHQMIFLHDELQYAIKEGEDYERVKTILEDCAFDAGIFWEIKTPIKAEVSPKGFTWADTH